MTLGLTDEQHFEVGQLILQSRNTTRPEDTGETGKRYLPPARVIALQDRVYNPLQSTLCPVFVYSRTKTVWVVEQVGSALAGYIAITINGRRFKLECRRENLTDVERAVPGLRATVFPGLWELDFGDKAGTVTVTAQNITSAENLSLCQLFDNVTSVIYSGSLIVRQEAWVSVPRLELSPAVQIVQVTDAIPYSTGSVTAGAIGLSVWSWDAAYLAMAWQCRNFSQATGYVQKTDPVILAGAT